MSGRTPSSGGVIPTGGRKKETGEKCATQGNTLVGSGGMHVGGYGEPGRHPCETTSSWLLDRFGRNAFSTRKSSQEFSVSQTAETLQLQEDDVRETMTMLLRAHVLEEVESPKERKRPFKMARWVGLRGAQKVAIDLRRQAMATFPTSPSVQGAQLNEKIVKRMRDGGEMKVSRFGVFSATMQLVMASSNGVALDTTVNDLEVLVEREKCSSTIHRDDLRYNVSNALHTMVGLGAIHKEYMPNTSIGAVFTWVGFENLDEAPQPTQPQQLSTTLHSRSRFVGGPGKARSQAKVRSSSGPVYLDDKNDDDPRIFEGGDMRIGAQWQPREHPCHRTSSWLLDKFGRDFSDGMRMSDLTVSETAKELGLHEEDVRECFTMLLGAHVVKDLSKEEDPQMPFERARWQGLGGVKKVASDLQQQAVETYWRGAPLRKRLVKGATSRGELKMSKFGVFAATMQVVMANHNGVALESATWDMLRFVERENPPCTVNRDHVRRNISNALHTMVGLGAINKECMPNASIGAVFTWVGVNLDPAPQPPPPSTRVHSRSGSKVPGVARAAVSMAPELPGPWMPAAKKARSCAEVCSSSGRVLLDDDSKDDDNKDDDSKDDDNKDDDSKDDDSKNDDNKNDDKKDDDGKDDDSKNDDNKNDDNKDDGNKDDGNKDDGNKDDGNKDDDNKDDDNKDDDHEKPRTVGSGGMTGGDVWHPREHPCHRTSSWLLDKFGRDFSDGMRMSDITVAETAKDLGLEEADVRECLTMLGRARVVQHLDKRTDRKGPFERVRWVGLGNLEEVAMALRLQATQTSREGAPLKKPLTKPTTSRGKLKMSRSGVFGASMQAVMESHNGVTLESLTNDILQLAEQEITSGIADHKSSLRCMVSNVLHTMVGVGAINKECMPNASIGALFTWVGVNLDRVPQPPPPPSVHSRNGSVRAPGVARAEVRSSSGRYLDDKDDDGQRRRAINTSMSIKRAKTSTTSGVPQRAENRRVLSSSPEVSQPPRVESRPIGDDHDDTGRLQEEYTRLKRAYREAALDVEKPEDNSAEGLNAAGEKAVATLIAACHVGKAAVDVLNAARRRSGRLAEVTVASAMKVAQATAVYLVANRRRVRILRAHAAELRRSAEGAGAEGAEAREKADFKEFCAVHDEAQRVIAEQYLREMGSYHKQLVDEREKALASSNPPAA